MSQRSRDEHEKPSSPPRTVDVGDQVIQTAELRCDTVSLTPLVIMTPAPTIMTLAANHDTKVICHDTDYVQRHANLPART